MPRAKPASPDGVDPRVVDAVLAVAMALAVAVVIAADLERTGRAVPAAYLFAAGFGVLVLARRRAPRVVLWLTVLGIFAYYTFGFPPIGIALPAIAALYSAAERSHLRSAAIAGVVLTAVAAYARIEEGLPTAYVASYEFLTNVALVAAAIAFGYSVHLRREARSQQERLNALTVLEQELAAENRVNTERMRIARDMHDVVGHGMSVIVLHGNVAAEAIGHDEAAAARAVQRIRDAAATTMRDLRATVKLLRTPGAGADEREAVGLSALPNLCRVARDAGVVAELRMDADPERVDGAVSAAAYRVVQEALTNVIRHADAACVRVRVRMAGDELEVEVADDGRGSVAAQDRDGHGIAGMTERVTLLGGTLSARNGTAGGFVVRARIPARLRT
ncbi:signal transduction histidine kinase [Saccharomonospora marina XMU15]|uniref:histidine kinase n=1 Tax=Saccharomonospora marina XMU15 TaxID=882083 RepID=H5X8G9_9PSEU|nr:sensor histidine kinase [Saccharomonospora marina]EHR50265.1 signal transduction histidine kinase [Saccharomonospora marina XMU15]